MINSFHAPEIGNVCLGVWEQVGFRHVKINQYAPLFGAGLVTFVGTLNIQQDLTLVPHGKTFEGPAMCTGNDADGNMTFQATAAVQGTRYTLKSPGH